MSAAPSGAWHDLDIRRKHHPGTICWNWSQKVSPFPAQKSDLLWMHFLVYFWVHFFCTLEHNFCKFEEKNRESSDLSVPFPGAQNARKCWKFSLVTKSWRGNDRTLCAQRCGDAIWHFSLNNGLGTYASCEQNENEKNRIWFLKQKVITFSSKNCAKNNWKSATILVSKNDARLGPKNEPIKG